MGIGKLNGVNENNTIYLSSCLGYENQSYEPKLTVPVVKDYTKKDLNAPIKGAQLEHAQEAETVKAEAPKEETKEAKAETAKAEAPKEETKEAKAETVKAEAPKEEAKEAKADEKAYDTRKKRNAAEKEIAKQFVAYGDVTGKKYTEKEAKKEAHKYVKNEQRKEEFETYNEKTTLYYDQKAYIAARDAGRKQAKELYKQYRSEGLSRKEAKEKAQSQIKQVHYVDDPSARKGFKRLNLIEADGTIGKKAQEYMIKQANIGNTQEGETTNYYYGLKERRTTKENERAQGNKVTTRQLGKMADELHLDKEKNMTGPYRIGAAAAILGTVIGTSYAIGGITAASGSSSGSIAGANAAGAAGGAAAGATGFGAAGSSAVIGPGALATFGSPLAALGVLFKDKGKKTEHIAQPGKPVIPPKPEEPKPPVKPEEPKPPVKPEEPEECPHEYEDAYCSHKVKSGDNWYNVVKASYKFNGKKLEDGSKELKAIIKAQQLMYGIENNKKGNFFKVGDEFKLYSNYSTLFNNEEIMKKYPQLQILKDAEIKVDCNSKYDAGKVVKGNFGIITKKGIRVQNEYDCYGNKVGTRVVNE